MITVGVDAADVERRLGEGSLRGPWCPGRLRGWGHARDRVVRGLAAGVRVRPRRARCGGCGRTQVLLPVTCWSRRADTVEVIGAAFTARAGGAGHRRIAAVLGRAVTTVRGWLRRLGGRLEQARSFLTAVIVGVAIEPVFPEATGSAWGDLLAALECLVAAILQRFGPSRPGGRGPGLVDGLVDGLVVGTVTVWQVACAVTDGGLLGPGWGPWSAGEAVRGCNTNWL